MQSRGTSLIVPVPRLCCDVPVFGKAHLSLSVVGHERLFLSPSLAWDIGLRLKGYGPTVRSFSPV